MKTRHLLSLLLISMTLAGCSFQQYFMIANSTDQTIRIKYSMEDPKSEKALFGTRGQVYQSTIDYSPDWQHELPYRDLNNSDNTVLIELGPKSTLVFGTLSNEKYDKTTMTSSTGKQFNLKEMAFSVNGTDYLIDASNFHDFFLEESGQFKYIIQP
ncbi:MAG: hypothetical protein AB8B56_12015 [Crocinitomicaceae bacterium]